MLRGAVPGALVGALLVLLTSAAGAGNPPPGSPGLLTPGASATAGASTSVATLPSNFQDSIVWSNLSLPTAIRFSPDGRILLAQKGGQVLEFDSLTDTTPTTVIDLSNVVDDYWDRGLLGLALDPNFPTNPYIYVLY